MSALARLRTTAVLWGLASLSLWPTPQVYGNLMFNDVYLDQVSGRQKAVLEAAQDAWSSKIGSNNTAANTFTVNIRVVALAGTTLASATDLMANAQGIPISATVQINLNLVNAFLDTTPNRDEEFNQSPDYPFQFTAKAAANDPLTGAPVSTEYDMLTILTHELGHALGFADVYAKFASHLSNSTQGGFRDYTLANNDFAVLPPENPTGHLAPGQIGRFQGKPYDQTNDLMNPSIDKGIRVHISDFDVAILRDAFGYTAPASAPEPSGALLLATGLVMVLALRRNRPGYLERSDRLSTPPLMKEPSR